MGHTDDEEVFETAAMLIAFILLGKMLESIAKGRTSRAISNLLRLQPPTALLVAGCWEGADEPKEVPLSTLKQRDVVGLGPTMLFRVRRKDVESWISPQRGEFWCTHKEWRDTDSWHVLDWAPSGAEGEQDGGNVLGGIAAFKEFRKPKRAGPGAGVAGTGVGMGYTFELVEWKAGSISGGESREE